MEIDPRVVRRYEVTDESERLRKPGRGDLVRLRTWDIFERFLPRSGRILDVGGGPGVHAEHLAGLGYEVTLVDPVPGHLAEATSRAQRAARPFEVRSGVAGQVPAEDGSADAVLLMGPLYHLVTPAERRAALAEARRVLRPGGCILAEIICRHAWLLDASIKELLHTPGIWDDLLRNIDSGLSQDPTNMSDGAFWAYFRRPDEIHAELVDAGFRDINLIAVEGYGWLLGDLDERMKQPELLVRAIRLTETEPSMLGCSGHVIGAATTPT